MSDNRKFLLDEFKRILSSCGFRAWEITELATGYRVAIPAREGVTFKQLLKLSQALGTENLEFSTKGYYSSYLEVRW